MFEGSLRTGTEMTGQVFSALEASRAMIADVRVSVHVDLDQIVGACCGGWRLVERALSVLGNSVRPNLPRLKANHVRGTDSAYPNPRPPQDNRLVSLQTTPTESRDPLPGGKHAAETSCPPGH